MIRREEEVDNARNGRIISSTKKDIKKELETPLADFRSEVLNPCWPWEETLLSQVEIGRPSRETIFILH